MPEYLVKISRGEGEQTLRIRADNAADARAIAWHRIKGTAVRDHNGVYHMARGKDVKDVQETGRGIR